MNIETVECSIDDYYSPFDRNYPFDRKHNITCKIHKLHMLRLQLKF